MEQPDRENENISSLPAEDTTGQQSHTQRPQGKTEGKAHRYGVGKQHPTPTGYRSAENISGVVGEEDVQGPSGNITGTSQDPNPRTRGKRE
ncbi:MAG TPA: hypothetical protein VFB38_22395 [Chthonomonadaceae bacterium]|nr:hypothetical protein [Chthonomonadaceae bacterium]